MFVVLTTIFLLRDKKKENNYSSDNNLKSSPKLLEVDSVKCYNSYQAALTALNAIPERHSITLKDGEVAAAATALTSFGSECALKVSVNPCKEFLTDNSATPGDGLGEDFTETCSIPSPTANAADCVTAYNALITAIQAITTTRKIDMMAAPAEEFDAFVTKCALTSHTKVCYDEIKDIDTTTGPKKTDLSKIQTNCNPVSKQPAGGSGEDGIHTFSLNFKIVMSICILFNIYFLI
jgi:hypothetical protein